MPEKNVNEEEHEIYSVLPGMKNNTHAPPPEILYNSNGSDITYLKKRIRLIILFLGIISWCFIFHLIFE